MAFTVFLDACTLHRPYVRDTLLRLAEAETYRPLWSRDVLTEVRSSLVEARGFDPAAIDYMLGELTDAFEDAVVAGYEPLIDVMTNDPGDCHVLAAAVKGGADALVTFNMRHFPPESVEAYRLEVLNPDAFLLNQFDLFPDVVMQVLDEQAASHRRPPHTVPELLDRLQRDGVTSFPAAVRSHLPG